MALKKSIARRSLQGDSFAATVLKQGTIKSDVVIYSPVKHYSITKRIYFRTAVYKLIVGSD